jgi:hypothetical protein
MKINYLGYAFLFLIILISTKMILDSEFYQLRCIYSDVDGRKYCVRERSKLTLAADKLADVRERLDRLVTRCKHNKGDLPAVQRLIANYNPKKICETLPTSEYTAYSENKGEKLAFCLDTEANNQGKLIDINTLTFVAIHEVAHIATKSIGHTQEFWDNFKMLLEEATAEGIYDPVDYKKKKVRYCGMDITDNPYYNK